MTKVFYLMRHGQTRFNEQGRIQGASDSPLTDLGIQQAQAAQAYFQENQIIFSKVYASTQERACDTAEIASGRSDYIRLKGLKEQDFGAFEGHQEYLNPHLFLDGSGYRDYFVAYGGEDNVSVYKRMEETLTAIMEEATSDDTVLVVSHGAAIGQFNANVAHNQLKRKSRFTNCCILKIAYADGKFEVLSGFNPVTSESLFEEE
ncbi:histidine phosphatase family protein [Streptococcus loxodontisalivarius]|uniref:Phosphoglycerate mutase n=1 Tax=Streptococcus loxodontisalivarius TaxID=1349415 RepID=A0ABS2PRX9_9STRE|nr:histidine phosphatase family protein [Streptococcus loxodontisalivarius]MBM7642797.1 putative phosphoglycerate mutase [Streptococcus loxodontisalivarius]